MDVDLYSTNDGIVEDAGEHPNDWVDQPISQNVARKTHAETTAKTKRSQINYYSKAYSNNTDRLNCASPNSKSSV